MSSCCLPAPVSIPRRARDVLLRRGVSGVLFGCRLGASCVLGCGTGQVCLLPGSRRRPGHTSVGLRVRTTGGGAKGAGGAEVGRERPGDGAGENGVGETEGWSSGAAGTETRTSERRTRTKAACGLPGADRCTTQTSAGCGRGRGRVPTRGTVLDTPERRGQRAVPAASMRRPAPNRTCAVFSGATTSRRQRNVRRAQRTRRSPRGLGPQRGEDGAANADVAQCGHGTGAARPGGRRLDSPARRRPAVREDVGTQSAMKPHAVRGGRGRAAPRGAR